MKHNYKIRLDEPPPSDDQIARHRNFDRILADYHHLTQPIYRKPLYKNPRAFIGLVLIFVIGFLVFEAVEEEKKQIAEREIPEAIRLAEQHAFLQPISPALALPYQNVTVPADAEKVVELDNGLQIEVPAGAFAYPDGTPVTGQDVRLSLRLVKDPVEMALSGIPMYTFDGEQPVALESDFLMDIHAEVNGKPVGLNSGKKLTVLLPALGKAPARDLGLYQLDTVQRQWINLKPGYQVLERPATKPSMVVKLPGSDGMNMVEFDENGDPIEVPESMALDSTGPALLYQRKLELESLGVFGLDRRLEKAGSTGLRSVPVQLQDADGKPVHSYALYKVLDGLNTVAYFWPLDKQFGFELTYLPGRAQTFFGFTEEGRLITLASSELENLDTKAEAQPIKVKVSPAPVKNIDELKQLLAAEGGQ